MTVQGNDSKREDDDDVASVNSDRSALSFSSEISINPYTKYPQPVQVHFLIPHSLSTCALENFSEC